MTDESNKERIAKILYEALKCGDDKAFFTVFDDGRNVVIDGNFDLIAVVEKLAAFGLSLGSQRG